MNTILNSKHNQFCMRVEHLGYTKSQKSTPLAFFFRKLLEYILYQIQAVNQGKVRQRIYETRDLTQKRDEGNYNNTTYLSSGKCSHSSHHLTTGKLEGWWVMGTGVIYTSTVF